MRIIDSHIHFYDLNNHINTWINQEIDKSFLKKNHLPHMLVEKSDSNIMGAVHIEAHDSKFETSIEIEWLDKTMQSVNNLKYRHIAFADITLPFLNFRCVIDKIRNYKSVKGIRHILSHHPNFEYNPCHFDASNNLNIFNNLKYLKAHNLIFNCQVYPYQLERLLPFIIQSNIQCVIDHFALPQWKKEEDIHHKLWKKIILKTAQSNKIFLKMSGLDLFQSIEKFDMVLDFCFENFPSHRLIYGSNNPVSFQGHYNTWLNYITAYFANKNIASSIQDKIFYQNAHKLFFTS